MATKNILPLIFGFCTLAVSAQTLPEVHECRYERTVEQQGTTIRSTQREHCVEDSQREIRRVQIGDLVRISQVSTHPVIKQDFYYRQTRCRWFAESNTANRDLVQFQGIVCEVQPNVWRVIDKF